MEEKNYIKLNKDKHGVKFWILSPEGEETGEFLDFHMTSVDLLATWDSLVEEDKKAKNWLNQELAIINKKQDFTPKGKFMSNNTRLKVEAQKEYILKEKAIYDKFLGENGVDKLLCGRPLEWDTLIEIDAIIKEQILPYLTKKLKSIEEEIKEKYSNNEVETL